MVSPRGLKQGIAQRARVGFFTRSDKTMLAEGSRTRIGVHLTQACALRRGDGGLFVGASLGTASSSSDRCDRLVERVDLADERTKRDAHAVGEHELAVVVETVGDQALQAIGVLGALGREDADLPHVPAQGVDERSAPGGATRARADSALTSVQRRAAA